MVRWRQSADATLGARERFGERVLVLTYEQLALDTEATMTRIAAAAGITMSPTLLTPTFNGRPIRANSSNPVERYGVLRDRVDAYRQALGRETIAYIDEQAGELFERAAEVAAAAAA
jgi:hypothetical protein